MSRIAFSNAKWNESGKKRSYLDTPITPCTAERVSNFGARVYLFDSRNEQTK